MNKGKTKNNVATNFKIIASAEIAINVIFELAIQWRVQDFRVQRFIKQPSGSNLVQLTIFTSPSSLQHLS